MKSNLDRYKADLDSLISSGQLLLCAIRRECGPEAFDKQLEATLKEKAEDIRKKLPSFRDSYQDWYSEAKVLVKQLLPDRLSDFVSYYERPKGRKSPDYESYRVEDYLQALSVTKFNGGHKEIVVQPDAAISQFKQQLAILSSVKRRFDSSLFEIRQMVRADLFDSELEAAEELVKNGFIRGAGAIAGVILERHLADTCENHNLKISKKTPGISDFNDALKSAGIVDVSLWRFIQHLGDIRNLCDHSKSKEPTRLQVSDLLDGVRKVTKTLY